MVIYTPMVVSSRSESSSVRSTLQRYDGRSLSKSKRIGIKAQGSGIRRDIVNIKSSGYSSSSIIKLSDSNSDFDLVIPHEIKDLILHSLLLKIASILN
ncbi:hypothetical protein QL285_073973 [Trifolium repens]|nr:hypothetical protein QL285_073973 [Trifolium repens]